MMNNKRGFIVIWIVLIALSLIILGLGYLYMNKIISALGSKWFIFAAIGVILIVFRDPVIQVLTMILTLVRSIFAKVGLRI